MSFKDFQNSRRGGHIENGKEMILTILNLHVTSRSPTKFQLNLTYGWIEPTDGLRCCFEKFQDGRHGSHLGHYNGTILTILSLHVALMPSTKFWLNLTYYLAQIISEEFQR